MLQMNAFCNEHKIPLQEQAKLPEPKKHVWVADPEDGFVTAEIKSTKGDVMQLMTAKGKEVWYLLLSLYLYIIIYYT